MKKNNSPIALEPHLTTELKTRFERIKALETQLGSIDGKLATITTDEALFISALNELEATSPYTDLTAVAAIHGKRGQLELLQRQRQNLKDTIVPDQSELKQHIEALTTFLPTIVKPESNAVLRRLREKLAPIYGNDASRLNGEALATPEYFSFCLFFHRTWDCYPHNVVRRAGEALPILAALVEGKNPWSFDLAAAE